MYISLLLYRLQRNHASSDDTGTNDSKGTPDPANTDHLASRTREGHNAGAVPVRCRSRGWVVRRERCRRACNARQVLHTDIVGSKRRAQARSLNELCDVEANTCSGIGRVDRVDVAERSWEDEVRRLSEQNLCVAVGNVANGRRWLSVDCAWDATCAAVCRDGDGERAVGCNSNVGD